MRIQTLIHSCIKKPLKIIIFFMCLFALSLITLFKIPVELFPATDTKTVSVTTRIRGGIPADQTEKLITIPLEKELSILDGISQINSVSKDSESTIIINFNQQTDTDTSILEINQTYEKIKHTLPKEIMPPVISKYNQYDDPIYIISVYSEEKSTEELRSIAKNKLKPAFLRIKGIANIEIAGGRKQKIIIEAAEHKLIQRKLSIHQVIQNISANNQNVLTGKITGTKNSFSVRTEAKYKNLEEIRELIVSSANQKDIIRLKDIATVKYGYSEAVDIARINGKKSVCLYIQKQSDANTIKVCNETAKKLKDISRSLAPKILTQTVLDKSVFIKKSLKNLLTALMFGMILAFLTVHLFLKDRRTTILVCLCIPLSLIFSIAGLYFFGFTLNINSISGLALGVGMLVDSSIVVSENMHQKLRIFKDFKKALTRAASELFIPLFAATASTVIVFVPMLASDPHTKELYSPLAAAVTFSLLFSLIISLILLPSVSAKLGYTKKAKDKTTEHDFFIPLKKAYKKLLLKTFRKQKLILQILLPLLTFSAVLIYASPKNISPFGRDNKFTVFVELKSGARLDLADEAVAEAESILKEVPEIEKTIVHIERWSGKIYVTLKDNTKTDTKTLMQKCLNLLKNTGVKQKAFIYLSSGNSSSEEIILNVYGHNYENMLKSAQNIHKTIAHDTDFYNFKYRYKPGRPEKIIKVDKKKALLFGFSTKDIAERLHAKVRGLIASEIFTAGKENEILVKLEENNRYTMEDIMSLHLISADNKKVPLKDIAIFKDAISPSQIWHLNQKRLIQISFSSRSYTLKSAVKKIGVLLKHIELEEQCFYEFDSSYKKLNKSYTNLKLALLLMLIFVYMIMASVFESYKKPLKIMLTLPFACIGIAASILFTGLEFSLGSLNGCMILGGICVNNAIIMTDYFAHLQKRMKSDVFAAISAATKRLRPILMTTLTTIAGLLPLVFASSSSAKIYRDMSITVILGLSVSTVIILFVFPLILSAKLFSRK